MMKINKHSEVHVTRTEERRVRHYTISDVIRLVKHL